MRANYLRFSALIVIIVAVVGAAPLMGSDADSIAKMCEQAKISNPWNLDKCPELFKQTLTALTFRDAFDSQALPAGGVVKSVEGNLRITILSGSDDKQFLLLSSKDSSATQQVNIGFSESVVLREISPLTGLPRRRGNQSEWRMNFYPGEAKLFEWLPGRLEPTNLRPRVALNPSSQYANVIKDDKGNQLYNEGANMWLIAVRIKDYLDRDGRVDAFITRRSQWQEMKLTWETGIAKLAKSDALVALHSDATGNNTPGGGTWTFYKDEEGKRLASSVQMPVLEAIKTVYPEVKLLGIREHWSRLHVLHNSGCPSSLTEILFHTNPKERELMKDPQFQDTVSKAFAEGILHFFGFEGLRRPSLAAD